MTEMMCINHCKQIKYLCIHIASASPSDVNTAWEKTLEGGKLASQKNR
jgi:hypothetical protein